MRIVTPTSIATAAVAKWRFGQACFQAAERSRSPNNSEEVSDNCSFATLSNLVFNDIKCKYNSVSADWLGRHSQ